MARGARSDDEVFVILIKADGSIQYATPNIEHLLPVHHGLAEMKGNNLLSWLHPEDADHMASVLAYLAATGCSSKPVAIRVATGAGRFSGYRGTAYNMLEDSRVQAILALLERDSQAEQAGQTAPDHERARKIPPEKANPAWVRRSGIDRRQFLYTGCIPER